MKNCINNKEHSFFWAFCVLIWIYGLLSIVFQPMLNDCMVFWSWAQQIKMSELIGLDAILSVWEIKGLLSRIWYYQVYLIASLFTPDIYPYGQYLFHFIGIIEIIALIGLALWAIPNETMNNRQKLLSFYVITLAVFSLTPMANLQPEILGLAVIILSFSLLLKESIGYQLLGGILCGSLIFIKTPLILLAGSIFFAYSIIKRKSFTRTLLSIWPYILTALFTVVVCVIMLYYYYPQEIQDIRDASSFQSTLVQMTPVHAVSAWQERFLDLWKMPIFLPILSIGLISLCLCVSLRSRSLIINLLLVWLFPYIYVTVSNCYFQYHFVTFIFPSLLSIFLVKEYWQYTISSKRLFRLIMVAFVIGLLCTHYKFYFLFRQISVLFFIFPFICMLLSMSERYRNNIGAYILVLLMFTVTSNNSLLSHSYRGSQKTIKETLIKNSENSIQINESLGEGPILRLDAGVSPIWINNESYLRHFFPLPIQRTDEESSFAKSNTFIEEKEKILKYQGDYIVIDTSWFFCLPHKEITEMINNNYEYAGTLYIPSNNGYNIFMRHPAIIRELQLLKRKEQHSYVDESEKCQL